MKRAFLIHGWQGVPDGSWRPWLKKELEKHGFEVFVPAMPDTNNPKMSAWIAHLANIAGAPDKDCYFVGHSLGCIAILRYLETLKENQKVGGVILVAGFTSNLGFKELESFFTKPIEWEKIKSHCSKFVAIHSDNDYYVSLHYADLFKENLEAEVIVQHNMGHFTNEDDILELPIALNSILKIQY